MRWLFVRRLRSFVLLAAAASFVLNVALLMPAIYMMQVFDRVFTSNSVETLIMLGLITLLFLVLGLFVDTVRSRALAWAGRSLDRKLAPAAIRSSLQEASAGAGRADTDALRDIAQLRTFLSGPGVLALFDAPWATLYLALITLMHPLLGLTAALGALVLVALGVITDRLTRDAAGQSLRSSRTSTRTAERLARNAEVIVGMGMTAAAVARWRQDHEQSLLAQETHSRASSVLAALARTLRQVLQVAMLGLGAWLVIDMQASSGIMIAATILLSRALQPVEHLISGWRALTDARGAWQRLGERAADVPADSSVALPAPSGLIEVERVAYAFAPSRPALLRNVTFTLSAGQSLGVIGASASGKTTLIRLLLGLARPQSGCVRLDGADTSRWDREALGQHVGYLPQAVELFSGTVGENIARLCAASGPEASERIVRAARLAHAHEMILQLPDGYETQIGEGGAVLSGGQRQRIALARALYGEPRLIVLDEPNANLDTVGEAALLAALAELKARAVTVIMVTHSPMLMAALDKLAHLKNGTLELYGPSAAVLARLRSPSSTQRVVALHSSKGNEALA
ncbi:MAG TPA: type I secretion system permease/ATPase [Steroidobacteraceae bacterium]|nr:type I secretion system permease/ATPase [Steroidobacteraceae bacterium]